MYSRPFGILVCDKVMDNSLTNFEVNIIMVFLFINKIWLQFSETLRNHTGLKSSIYKKYFS